VDRNVRLNKIKHVSLLKCCQNLDYANNECEYLAKDSVSKYPLREFTIWKGKTCGMKIPEVICQEPSSQGTKGPTKARVSAFWRKPNEPHSETAIFIHSLGAKDGSGI
jgi:hypothetical protein